MVAQMRTALQSITGAQKALAALTGIGVTVAGVVIGLSGYLSLPAQTAAMEVRLSNIDARVLSLEEFRRFQGCWMLEQAAGRDPNPCRYLLNDPDEFRPPFQAVEP